MKADFIVFEGIDGSGKSTQCRMLYNYIEGVGRKVRHLAEPTSGKWGAELRAMLKSSAPPPVNIQIELFIKDRMDDYTGNIKPCMDNDITVVMDRYFYSNAAYQGCSGIAPHDIISMNIKEGFPVPDRVYFIDVKAETAMERIIKRNGHGNTELFEKKEFLESVRKNFLSLADDRFLVINGESGIDEIFEIIKNDYNTFFKQTK